MSFAFSGVDERQFGEISVEGIPPMPDAKPVVNFGSGQDTGAREPLLRQKEAARILNVSPRTLEAWRYRGGGPVYIAMTPRSVRYRVSDLEAWANQRVRRSTSDTGDQAE